MSSTNSTIHNCSNIERGNHAIWIFTKIEATIQAIELDTHIHSNGKISLPEAYEEWFGKNTRLILLESPEPRPEVSAYDIYAQLDLGEGSYSQTSSAETEV